MYNGFTEFLNHPLKGVFMSVSLSKGQSVSLAKKNDVYSNISINLKWNQKKSGFFSSLMGKNSIDLDVGCLYELQDGSKSCVQALGNAFGNFNHAPFIQLDGDDRSGSNQDGETIMINGTMWNKIKRVLIYAYIYEGVAKWSEADGIVKVSTDVEQVDIVLDNSINGKAMCGIALLENVDGKMKVTKINDYFSGHKELDRAFNWNLNWVAGSKD